MVFNATFNNISVILWQYIQWNMCNLTHQGTTEICRIVQDVGFILVNRNTLGP
jgi:hypothetical protein